MIIENVSKRFGDFTALNNFSLELPDQGLFLLQGPSGWGKTTLLRLIAGLIQPDEGRILGAEGKRIAFVFQEDRLLPWLSARKNVALVRPDKPIEEADALLAQMGLAGFENFLPGELSGGMRRRTALARALFYDGDIVLLDEPFQGVDDLRKEEIMPILKKAVEGKLAIMVTHSGGLEGFELRELNNSLEA